MLTFRLECTNCIYYRFKTFELQTNSKDYVTMMMDGHRVPYCSLYGTIVSVRIGELPDYCRYTDLYLMEQWR